VVVFIDLGAPRAVAGVRLLNAGEGGGGGGGDGEAVNKRLKVVESSVKTFSEKLGADVEAWHKAMNAELQSAIAKVKEQMRVNHEQVTKMADDVASMRQAANLGGTATTAAGAAADVAALGKRLKAVEESVKTFSSKLGTDVEAWQQAINTELQSALGKVKEQVFKNADAVQTVAHDVEGLTGGKPPEGGDGAAAAAGAKGPHDAAAQAALQKRVKVLEATLAAHEMALQAHTETLEAHATWLECVGAPARLPPPRPAPPRPAPPRPAPPRPAQAAGRQQPGRRGW
jgi:archaellum component FlaC